MVTALPTLLTMQLGPGDILVAAKVDFDDEAHRRGIEEASDEAERRLRARYPASGTSSWTRRAARPGATTATAESTKVAAMVRWRSGTVPAVRRRVARRRRTGRRRPTTATAAGAGLPGTWSARPSAGDRVLLNVGALVMGLGTGGYALVVALPDRLPPDPPRPAPTRDAGHLVKARYTPLQAIRAGRRRAGVPAPRGACGGRPTSTACRWWWPTCTRRCRRSWPASAPTAPDARVAYVMTDGGALPAWFSRTLDGLRDRRWPAR